MTINTDLIDWPKKLDLALLPTPLQKLERLSAKLGGPTIWIKRDDLSGSLLSGNKVRKLEFTVAHAKAEGSEVLITCGGLQSNHCRATAVVGAQLGMPVHLVLRGTLEEAKNAELDGNLLLDHLVGAKVDYYPREDYQKNLKNILASVKEDYRLNVQKAHVIPTGASDGIGLWGYVSACKELAEDFRVNRFSPDLIVTATGSGGTQAGLTLGAKLFDFGCNVLGFAVCDDTAYFKRKVTADITEFKVRYAQRFDASFTGANRDVFSEAMAGIYTNEQYIGDGYAIASDEVLRSIIMLSRLEGIVLDPVYTGKAFHGLIQEIKKGRFNHLENIVFLHTGGGFGLFPYKDRLQKLMS